MFRQAIIQYWHDTPHTWELLDALAEAESSYRPGVVSHVGAVGLLQVMPRTWRDIRQQGIDVGDDLTDPRDNIRAGGYYLRRMYRIFSDERRTEDDRLRVAAASYNAGPGNLLKAQKLAVAEGKVGVAFDELAGELASVTGSHAAGTVQYSNKIVRNYRGSQATEMPREVVAKDTVTASLAGSDMPTAIVGSAPSATVRVVVEQESSVDWSELIGLLYIILSGGKKDD